MTPTLSPTSLAPRRPVRGAPGPDSPSLDTIGPLVHAVAKSWREELDRRLRPLGLTRIQWLALLMVSRAPHGITQRELADALDIGAPATVALVDRMERDNLVARVPVPGDRRRNAIRATPASRRLFTRIEAAADVLRHEILGSLTKDELATLHRLLTKTKRRIEAVRA